MRWFLITVLVALATQSLQAELVDADGVQAAVDVDRRVLGGLLDGVLGNILGGATGDKTSGGLLGLGNFVTSLTGALGKLVGSLVGKGGLLEGLDKGLVGSLVSTLAKNFPINVVIQIVGQLLCVIKQLGLQVVIYLLQSLKVDVMLSLNTFLCTANGSRLFDEVNGTAKIEASGCLLNILSDILLDITSVLRLILKLDLDLGLKEICENPVGGSLVKGIFKLLGKVLNPELITKILAILKSVDLNNLPGSIEKIIKNIECLLKYFGVGVKLTFLLDLLQVLGFKFVLDAEAVFCNASDADIKAEALLKLNQAIGEQATAKWIEQAGLAIVLEIIIKVLTQLREIRLEVIRAILCMMVSFGVDLFMGVFRSVAVSVLLQLSGLVCSSLGEPVIASADAKVLAELIKLCSGPSSPECSAQLNFSFTATACAKVCGYCEGMGEASPQVYGAFRDECLDKCSTECPTFVGSAPVTTESPGAGGLSSGR
ncbi:uncharacterized protein LOC131941040 [Physella acuta]|uniref:uncharacterized protein LOC131941040 n=1 Tax=Physella acuta TaxID=109671 RepID=UPI0027DD7ED2|nr:uncharacterized protein LOC131941040 [Physella acuta]